MKGWVKIFENNKLIREGHNLILNEGRRLQAHRVSNTPEPNVDYTNHYISHFCIGTAGSDAFNLLVPIEPQPTDTIHNMQPLVLKDPTQNLAPNYILGNKLKKINNIEIITPTQIQLTLIIEKEDIHYSPEIDDVFYYNELGIFATLYGNGDNPILIARFTTSLTPKTQYHSQTVYWNLFF